MTPVSLIKQSPEKHLEGDNTPQQGLLPPKRSRGTLTPGGHGHNLVPAGS